MLGPGPLPHSSGVRAWIASVMPWYAQSVVMPPLPPVAARAMRHAMSFASEPELTNITASSAPPVEAISRSATSNAVSCR